MMKRVYTQYKSYIVAAISLVLILGILAFVWQTGTNSLVRDRTFTIAIDTNWPSLEIMAKKRNLTAFCDNLVRSIAEAEKLKVQIIQTDTSVAQGLDSGRYDGVVTAYTPALPSLSTYLVSSDIIYHTGPVLVVPINSTAKSLKDLSRKNVGMIENLTRMNIEDFPAIVFIHYRTAAIALNDLVNGKLDGVIMNTLLANNFIKGLYAGQLKVATAPFTNDGLRLIMNKDIESEKFMEMFNRGFQQLKKNGQYDALIKFWDLIDTTP